MEQLSYIPGLLPPHPGPLGRYLPQVPVGVASTWLKRQAPSGAWVLDPFGSSSRLVIEAARAGYRVLVASNNPIDRFLIDLAANPPTEAEMRSSLADLGATMKGDQRIEPFLQNLYTTTCPQCQQEVSAEAFIWDRGATVPFTRILHCLHCGESGEFPVIQSDEIKLAQLPSSHLYRSRALERVTPLDDPDRAFVEEALDVYLPRALYALFTLINKVESLPTSRRRPITALLLATFDQANTLWLHPTQRARPRQLTVPPHFRENNIWVAMVEAIENWTQAFPAGSERLPIVHWPQHPPDTGGICLFQGRLKDLIEQLRAVNAPGENRATLTIHSVISALPRPNQAYWTLSALWSGWLWGREAAAPYKVALHRRRYDWNWHCNALNSIFNSLKEILQPGVKIFSSIGETEPGFLSAALLAAASAGLELDGISMCQSEDQAQIEWSQLLSAPKHSTELPKQSIVEKFIEIAQQTGLEYLRQRSEPANYLQLHTSALAGIIENNIIQVPEASKTGKDEVLPAEYFSMLQSSFQQTFTYRSGFIRFHGSPNSLETGQWWVRETNNPINAMEDESIKTKSEWITYTRDLDAPLADRVEIEIVRALIKQNQLTQNEIDEIIFRKFRGLYTPELDLLRTCLESYAEPDSAGSIYWRLRSQEAPMQRRSDLDVIYRLIQELGQKLNFTMGQPNPLIRQVIWQDDNERLAYVFFPIASAVIGKLITTLEFIPQRSFLVYPGGRAALIRYKLRRDPRLQAFIDQGWRFLKFRHIRRLAENDQLTRENLDDQLDLDPMGNQDPQIAFI